MVHKSSDNFHLSVIVQRAYPFLEPVALFFIFYSSVPA